MPVIGEPPAVASAICVVRKRSRIMPISLKPTVLLNCTRTGIMIIVRIILLAKFVIIVAKSIVATINTSGGNLVKGMSMAAKVLATPVSGSVKNEEMMIINVVSRKTSQGNFCPMV